MGLLISLLKKPFQVFKRLSFKKKIIVIVVLIVVVFFVWNRIGSGKGERYVMGEASRATITQTVSEIGNVETGGSVVVTSPSTGVVEGVLVENGDQVSTGDLLFTVKSSATEQERAVAYSNYLAAISALNTAISTEHSLKSTMLSKWKTFYDLATNPTYEDDDGTPRIQERTSVEFNMAREDWLAAEAKFKDQQNVIAQAQADVNSKWILYQATQNAEVKATSKGAIVNLAVVSGGNVKGNDIALMIISDNKNQFVRLPINEIDIPKIKEGQKAEIEIDAIDGEKFRGEVARVDRIGTNTQGVITHNVYIMFDETHPSIRSQMTANVEIKTQTREDVLSVPNSAVKPYRGGRAVQVLEGKDLKYIPVVIGIRGDERSEIIRGVEEGQKIIIGEKNKSIQRQGPFGF